MPLQIAQDQNYLVVLENIDPQDWAKPGADVILQRIKQQPRDVLREIPGLEVLEVPESALCCGSAGIYNLIEPKAAQQLGDRKVSNVLSTGAQMVVSSNPGCLLQLRNGLERARKPIATRHIVEVLDASIRGTSLI